MAAGASALREWVRVDEAHLVLEFGVVALGNGFHRVENFPVASLGAFLGLTERCGDEPGIGRIEVLAQVLDELDRGLYIWAGRG